MTRYASTLALTLALTGAQAAPALALNNRTWISGTGTDAAGCGPIAIQLSSRLDVMLRDAPAALLSTRAVEFRVRF